MLKIDFFSGYNYNLQFTNTKLSNIQNIQLDNSLDLKCLLATTKQANDQDQCEHWLQFYHPTMIFKYFKKIINIKKIPKKTNLPNVVQSPATNVEQKMMSSLIKSSRKVSIQLLLSETTWMMTPVEDILFYF